jgi:hypothetical protein
VRSEELRSTRWIVDMSGKAADPASVLRRLQNGKLSKVAIGGVLAARHYHAAFDLHGTPRIDLSMWRPRNGSYDPAAIAKTYPGLVISEKRHPDAVIAVHCLARADAMFEPNAGRLPYADVAETLLDLYELRLTAQAQALVKHVRGDAP